MRKKQRTGFTLIELLVVIAIIAIIAAILFPVFAQAREKARAATCLSNMKQLGSAVQMYMQDYDGAYPQAWFNPGQYGWDVMLWPYIKSYQVYECPSNRVTPRYWKGNKDRGLGPIPGSYAMNDDVTWRPEGVVGRSDRAGITEAAVQSPADTILMSEIRDHRPNEVSFEGHKAGPSHALVTNMPTATLQKYEVCELLPLNIHQGGTNYTFCDGHAKWLRVEQTWNLWRTDGTELKGDSTHCDTRRK
jgi:prepilin-type N-terminal cleavage/methylation domain-containing protein/prepilin-type processing-associated H-X9-DG protein